MFSEQPTWLMLSIDITCRYYLELPSGLSTVAVAIRTEYRD
jgi:hypothetical protein